MKKFLIPILIVAFGVAFYEQTKVEKNVYILVVAVVVFMLGMLRLSAKIPSKNQDKTDEHVD